MRLTRRQLEGMIRKAMSLNERWAGVVGETSRGLTFRADEHSVEIEGVSEGQDPIHLSREDVTDIAVAMKIRIE